MKSHLSHILPVWKACEILGEETVERVVSSILLLRRPQQHRQQQQQYQQQASAAANNNSSDKTATQRIDQQEQDKKLLLAQEQDKKLLIAALFYRPLEKNRPHSVPPPSTAVTMAQRRQGEQQQQWRSTGSINSDEGTTSADAAPGGGVVPPGRNRNNSSVRPSPPSKSVSTSSSSPVVSGSSSSSQQQQQQSDSPAPVPAQIASAWKVWLTSRRLTFDKASLIHFLVPASVQPHSGAAGHMGLFDCLTYALQGHAMSSTTTSYYGGAASNQITVPDVLILLAVVQNYVTLQQREREQRQNKSRTSSSQSKRRSDDDADASEKDGESTEGQQDPSHSSDGIVNDSVSSRQEEGGDSEVKEDNGDDENSDTCNSGDEQEENDDHTVISTMTVLAYRIYDAYQKKGIVSRDTVHRFLTDVHGEDSFKKPEAQRVLDDIFQSDAKQRVGPSNSTIPEATTNKDNVVEDAGDPEVDASQKSIPKEKKTMSPRPAGWLNATVSQKQFCERILTSMLRRQQDDSELEDSNKSSHRRPQLYPHHLLLDWMAALIGACSPRACVPPTVEAYFRCLDRATAAQRSTPLTVRYSLADSRLYEIKRRFHGLVQKQQQQHQQDNIIQGDPMQIGVSPPSATNNNIKSLATSPAAPSSSSLESHQHTQQHPPKNTIGLTAFTEAVCATNEEMGHGGFLTRDLARLLFLAGSRILQDEPQDFGEGIISSPDASPSIYGDSMTNQLHSNPGSDGSDENSDRNSKAYWGLYHILQFGCMANRVPSTTIIGISGKPHLKEAFDIPIYRFLMHMFQLTAPASSALLVSAPSSIFEDDSAEHATIDENAPNDCNNDNSNKDTQSLTREQVAHMLRLLFLFRDFREKADRPATYDGNDEYGSSDEEQADTEDIPSQPVLLDMLVDVDKALSLELLPANYAPPKQKNNVSGPTKKSRAQQNSQNKVPLQALVDYAMQDCKRSDQMMFDEFVQWTTATTNKGGAGTRTKDGTPYATRLGSIVLELRMVAACLFGIPPVQASMELALISEIERRHLSRYPQSPTSRRGPRGTVWYLMDAVWFQQWVDTVKRQVRRRSAAAITAVDDHADEVGDANIVDLVDGRDVADATSRVRGGAIGKIRNAALLAENLALRSDIRWKHDYEILPPLAWSALQAWYDGGPPIHRTVVRSMAAPTSPHTALSTPSNNQTRHRQSIPTENEIEFYPLHVTVYLCNSRGEAVPLLQNFQLSLVAPVRVMLVQLCKELRADPSKARLWVMTKKNDELPSSGSFSSSITAGALGGGRALEDNKATLSLSITSPSTSATSIEDWIVDLDENIFDQRKRRNTDVQPSDGISGSSSSSTREPLLMLLELKDEETGKWPRGLDGKAWTYQQLERQQLEQADQTESDLGDGVVGLHNMGNTCYLNSSIQCLSHTPIFREYFTSKAYLRDINTTNPLGHQGQLAQVSAMLINHLWKRSQQHPYAIAGARHSKQVRSPGSHAPVSAQSLTPRTFKDSLGKFNDHFSGNEQHDAQELLAFLLGGLSEDLNRIVDKPYMEAPDSDGRPDAELADIWWSNHLKRELSIVVALFTGQYKSLLTCKSCKYESARFEPFSFLQLPLPVDDIYQVHAVLYPLVDGKPVMKYCVEVRSDGKLRDFLVELAKIIVEDEKEQEQETSPLDDKTVTEAVAVGSTYNEEKKNSSNVANSVDEKVHGYARGYDEDEHDEMEQRCAIQAQNLAVVDATRDGYIKKIFPNTWKLQTLEDKETGDIQLLHVYELEPVINEDDEEQSQKSVDHEKDGGDHDIKRATYQDDDSIGVAHIGEKTENDVVQHDHPSKNSSNNRSSDCGRGEQAKSSDKRQERPQKTASFLAVAQRRSEVTCREYLHPLAHRVFGTPLLIRVNDLSNKTGREIYDLIAKRLRNVVPRSALRFLTTSTRRTAVTTIPNEGCVEGSKEGQPFYDGEHSNSPHVGRSSRESASATTANTNPSLEVLATSRTLSDDEDVSAGVVPRYGFRLRVTSREGRRCSICPWYKCCIGCLVPDDDHPTIIIDGDSVVVDWHFSVDVATSGFGSRATKHEPIDGTTQTSSQSTSSNRAGRIPSVLIRNHHSTGTKKATGLGKARGADSTCVTLEDCLDAFAKEERIPEAYCSKCKDFRVQTKRMSLWRLPPIVIIQLKRFHFTQQIRRKLRNLVEFPIEGLDLSLIMATDNTDASVSSATAMKNVVSPKQNGTINTALSGHHENKNGRDCGEDQDAATECTETTETATAGMDDDQFTKDKGRSNMLYDLYAVVHHQGALTGGHYVASLKSELDGKWLLFNDAQIFEIHPKDVVDESAYILFYIRRDVLSEGKTLKDFWDISTKQGVGVSEEDMDQLMKGRYDRCVIS